MTGPGPAGKPAPVASPATSAAAPSTAFVPAKSPARLGAACPFLDAAEIARAFGDDNGYASSEDPPDTEGDITSYTCEYRRADDQDYEWAELTVIAAPGHPSRKTALQVSTQDCSDKPQALSEAAVYCGNSDHGTDITVAKSSHGEMRVALLTLTLASTDTFREGYTTLASTIAERL
ncbi:hypothetical protein VSH64_25790 [Amycolatopsis rhabdoformis]|uniref:DUF3558 domain-containing protein n=1 Tax=Amycolatopsis rhabdoformis TaxID=1448059 RepID=A0ABZ1HY44_9PSEU|nr:hypothetical protein [Amycolatopsis rhabdoformis]WSE26290.1 hypothetical protein VSH64_25790 [Amycolatopsis rhabdoformis]